ncbi:MAG: LysR family transcriptional regulator [Brooklawnia sp.]|jgi:DNA-binding transcriptional LysR family regulator
MGWPHLHELELLVRTGELGSLSRAAQACGMAQPNATRIIARLERRIGRALLVRSSAGSRLTEEGALVAQWAEPLLLAGTEFAAAVATLREDIAHELHIMASQTIAECYAPGWLAEFRRTHPDHKVKMSVHNSTQIMARQLAGDDRLGLVESATVSEGLTAVPIGTDQLVVIVRPDHLWARRRSPVDLARLARTPLVVREEGSGTREVLDRALADLGPVEPQLVVSSNAGVLGSVVAGVAPAVTSERAVAAAVATRQVVQVAVAEASRLRRTLHAVWPSGAPLLGAAVDMLALIRDRSAAN